MTLTDDLLRRRSLVAAAALLVLATHLWHAAPARATGPPVCTEAGVGEESLTGQAFETPEACPYVDGSILRDVLPPDPGVWNALPPTAKSLFLPARTAPGPNVIEPNVGTPLLPPGLVNDGVFCSAITVTIGAENSLGVALWTYGQRVELCSNGRHIVRLQRTRWGHAHSPLWTFDGHIASGKVGRPPARTIGRYTKGQFSFLLGVDRDKPWIDIWVHADGGKEWDAGVD
jgi:hypothetical protein